MTSDPHPGARRVPDRAPAPSATRTTVVWVPDWPVAAAAGAARVPGHVPTAVHDGRRIVATDALARAEGVRRGMRRRQAQGCCPELVLLPADDARDVRAFEPVAVAVEGIVAGIEVARPGLLLLPAGGASRYHGSEEALAVALVDAVAGTGHECGVGTADGLLAAVLAARTGAVVPPGRSAAFLAGYGIDELVHATVTDDQAVQVADLVDLLQRLGLRTLGALAGLPAGAVHARFGRLGTWAHVLANGRDERPPARRRPEADLVVTADLDPPLSRVDQATFAGRRLAERLHDDLVTRGVACGRLEVAATADDGTVLARTWRTDLGGWGGLTPARMTDRIRWQLEGWLSDASAGRGREEDPLTLVRLTLTALDVLPAATEQGRLWGGPSGGDLRAHRALERVQGMLGGSGVLVATPAGGRDVRAQVHLRAWGEQTDPPRPFDRPWRGRLPEPAPATVLTAAHPVELRDATGAMVGYDLRTGLSGEPATVAWPREAGAAGFPAVERDDEPSPSWRGTSGAGRGARSSAIAGWAGPWPVCERWWAPGSPGPTVRAYLQVVLDDGRAVLLVGNPGAGWTCEATYD